MIRTFFSCIYSGACSGPRNSREFSIRTGGQGLCLLEITIYKHENYGIQEWLFTFQKGHRYSLWTIMNISEEDGGGIADFTNLNIMKRNQIEVLFKTRMRMTLQSQLIKESDLEGNRGTVWNYGVETIVKDDGFEDLPPEYKKIRPRNRGLKGELREDFCNFKSSRLGIARLPPDLVELVCAHATTRDGEEEMKDYCENISEIPSSPCALARI